MGLCAGCRFPFPEESADSEAVDDLLAVGLARVEQRRREVGVVHGIGVVLAFDGHAVVVGILSAVLGLGAAAREPVARVDHHAGLRREHLDSAARTRVAQRAHLTQDVGLPAVDDEGMVVSLEVADVVELGVDARSERPERPEILRCTLYVEQLPRRDLPLVHFEHLRGVELQLVVENRPGVFARQVEIDVVREIHDGGPVGAGQIGDLQRAVFVEVEDRLDAQLARITLVAVLREQGHDHAVGLHAALPDPVGKVLRAAVQVVHAVVYFERVLLALDGHPAVGDAVGAAAHALAGGGSVVEIALGSLVAQHDVGHAAFAVGHHGGDDCRAIVREAHLGAAVVAQRVEDDRLAFGGHTPDMLLDIYHLIRRV